MAMFSPEGVVRLGLSITSTANSGYSILKDAISFRGGEILFQDSPQQGFDGGLPIITGNNYGEFWHRLLAHV